MIFPTSLPSLTLLKSEDYGKHCHSLEFGVQVLDRSFLVFIGLSSPVCKVLVMHWPNRIYLSFAWDLRIAHIGKFDTLYLDKLQIKLAGMPHVDVSIATLSHTVCCLSIAHKKVSKATMSFCELIGRQNMVISLLNILSGWMNPVLKAIQTNTQMDGHRVVLNFPMCASPRF